MTNSFPLVIVAAVLVAAYMLIRVPRALFTQAGEAPPSKGLEWGLMAVLAAAGLAAYLACSGHSPMGRLAFALAAMVLAAVVYSDFSFLILPDLYSLTLVVIALFTPWRLPLGEAVLGAAMCGGLLGAVAFIWRTLRGAEGLGFGDVKLAAALGALLGGQAGLLAMSLSAALAAVAALVLRALRARRRKDPWAEERLIPYGAALGLAGMGFLAHGLL